MLALRVARTVGGIRRGRSTPTTSRAATNGLRGTTLTRSLANDNGAPDVLFSPLTAVPRFRAGQRGNVAASVVEQGLKFAVVTGGRRTHRATLPGRRPADRGRPGASVEPPELEPMRAPQPALCGRRSSTSLKESLRRTMLVPRSIDATIRQLCVRPTSLRSPREDRGLAAADAPIAPLPRVSDPHCAAAGAAAVGQRRQEREGRRERGLSPRVAHTLRRRVRPHQASWSPAATRLPPEPRQRHCEGCVGGGPWGALRGAFEAARSAVGSGAPHRRSRVSLTP